MKIKKGDKVKAGDVLAVLTPEDRGDPGLDLMGNVIKPRDVKKLRLKFLS